MQRTGDTNLRKLFALLTSLALVLTVATPAFANDPAAAPPEEDSGAAPLSDNLPNPLAEKQRALRTAAQAAVLNGEVTPLGDNKVVNVAKGQFVELARTGEDSILTVLGEFGTATDPFHHGLRTSAAHANHGGTPGPLHNEIPEPDRTVDNTTIWHPDFSSAYYQDLLFDESPGAVSMRNMYIEMSSNRYTVNGHVSDWNQVPFNAANYGSNYCGDIVCQDTWFFVQDSLNAWVTNLENGGMTTTDINAFLADFDVWDRYDHDGDGNFDEADGYIDHFQSVHAGEGEETGGGAQGTDAIWSHRWYVQLTPIGAGGPTVDGEVVPFGGTQIGDTNYWVGDYTIEPENGGVGVFAHEFGHDLGLPDLYDTSGNTGGAENSTAFWTLMSSGSYGSSGVAADGIGSKPIHMGAWEKFQLGWLGFPGDPQGIFYDVARAGAKSSHRLGPVEAATKKAQALFVLLPDKVVPLELGAPYEGTQYYYSGAGDDLDNSMTREVTLPAEGNTLTAKVRYDIETDWDYAYLTVNGTGVATSLSTTTNPNGQNFGNGITGSSGGNWVDLTADLSAFAGQTVTIGFRYWTDGAEVRPGFQVDALQIPGQLLDGAETDAGWTLDGFRTTTGSETQSFFNAYVVENRQYIGFDDSLRTGPYNFGWLHDPTKQNLVEHFSYQDGILISYWDDSYADNSVGDHPGHGLILPIDAHPGINHWADGTMMRCRIQSYDSTFGLQATEAYTLHNNGVAASIGGLPAVPVFDDSKSYWTDEASAGAGHAGDHLGIPRDEPEFCSVIVPNTGTTIRVKSMSSTGFAQIDVNK